MSKSIEIRIWGKPIGKKSPRFARRGNWVAAINDQQTEEGRFLLNVREQSHGQKLSGPLKMQMFFAMPIPKSTSKKQQLRMALNEILPTKKPDLKNLIAFAEDVLSGEIFQDDCQVCIIEAMKRYGDPHTWIRIEEMTSDIS